jgi:hypothetical protein
MPWTGPFDIDGFILRDASLRDAPLRMRVSSQTLMVRSASSRVSNHEASGEATMIRGNRKTPCFDAFS